MPPRCKRCNCLKYSRIREVQQLPPQTHLQLFVSSLGQFSGQGVQSLFDGSVHRQHVGQLAQGRIQLTHKHTNRQNSRLKLTNNRAIIMIMKATAFNSIIEKVLLHQKSGPGP